VNIMADTTVPINELFTPASIVSVGVASGAVTVAANTLYKLFGVQQKFTAAVASLVLAYGYVVIKSNPVPFEWVLAFFNGCLLFCTAMGMNDAGDRLAPGKQGFTPSATPAGRRFWKPWL
jgi:hypothetical protein